MVIGLPEFPLTCVVSCVVIVPQRCAVSPGPIFPDCFGLAQFPDVLNQLALWEFE